MRCDGAATCPRRIEQDTSDSVVVIYNVIEAYIAPSAIPIGICQRDPFSEYCSITTPLEVSLERRIGFGASRRHYCSEVNQEVALMIGQTASPCNIWARGDTGCRRRYVTLAPIGLFTLLGTNRLFVGLYEVFKDHGDVRRCPRQLDGFGGRVGSMGWCPFFTEMQRTIKIPNTRKCSEHRCKTTEGSKYLRIIVITERTHTKKDDIPHVQRQQNEGQTALQRLSRRLLNLG